MFQKKTLPTKTVYKIDDDGYFEKAIFAQKHPKTGQWWLPNNAVEVELDAEKMETHFAKWVNGVWEYEPKPVSASEFVGRQVSHKSQTVHDIYLRNLLQKLVQEDSEHYRVIRGTEEEGLWWGVEAIPEKTAEELAEEARLAEIAELKRKLAETDYVAVKIAEGVATKEDYAEVLEQRAQWRARINELEAEAN